MIESRKIDFKLLRKQKRDLVEIQGFLKVYDPVDVTVFLEDQANLSAPGTPRGHRVASRAVRDWLRSLEGIVGLVDAIQESREEEK